MEGDLITQLGHTCQSDGTGFDPYATSTVTIYNVRFTSIRDVAQTSQMRKQRPFPSA